MPKASSPLNKTSGASTNLILTLVVVIIAVVVIGGVLLANKATTSSNGDQNVGAAAVPADLLRTPDSHTLTEAPAGEVTVVEFLDFQCPACAQYYQHITRQVERDYQGRITFVVRNFPLDAHPLALPAAQAAEAAGRQGKFTQMYHALFDNYDSWAVDPSGQQLSDDAPRARAQFDSFARQIGLDLEQFHRDMSSDQVAARIAQDQADGAEAGVTGTPTLFINGQQFEPDGQTYPEVAAQLRGDLDRELS